MPLVISGGNWYDQGNLVAGTQRWIYRRRQPLSRL